MTLLTPTNGSPPVRTAGPPGHPKSVMENRFRRAMMKGCAYANSVHDRFDAEYPSHAYSHPAMSIFKPRDKQSPEEQWKDRIVLRHYRGKAKAEAKHKAKV